MAVLALTPENKIVLVEQYRKPMERALVEIPAGKLEPGEKPEVTAVRELEEETGYECNRLDHIISFYTSPGFADELIHLYLATGLRKKENPRAADEDEFVELIEVSLEEAIQLVKEQKIFDAKTGICNSIFTVKRGAKIMMKNYFVDLHIHIGRTKTGKPVKITGSKTLTLTNILKAAKIPKGLDMIGVIDCHSPEVIAEIEDLLQSKEMIEMEDGGLLYQESVTLIPGVEIEINDDNCKGPLHVLGYFPSLGSLKEFSYWYTGKVKNNQLSTQRIHEDARSLQKK